MHELGPEDLERFRAMLALFSRVFEMPETYAAAQPDADYARRLLAAEHFIALVAEADGAVIGGLAAYVLDKFEQARREIYIYDLAVDAGWRRRGVATALIRRLQALARARGAWVIFVQADHGDDPAIALYQGLGHREDVLHFDISPEG
ncbi:AAC(3)-I family aminoglycoside N-acetyltransferase [Roseovarius azorensis]|uniref:AAC(3)-I family aminoglycoside N-acetyltransferase n=1 Tax=Roseovarius azorensis TaxID=1287727 RepID=UPI00318352C8